MPLCYRDETRHTYIDYYVGLKNGPVATVIMCNGWVGACRSGMRAHAAHEAQGTHARAKMTGQGQFLHVLMRMGCGDELPETAAEICALAGGPVRLWSCPSRAPHTKPTRLGDAPSEGSSERRNILTPGFL